MAIQSAADHGYRAQPEPLRVRIGDVFRTRCADGLSEHRVLRHHRDVGYYETVFVRWVGGEKDYPGRNSLVGSIEVVSREKILASLVAA